MQARPPTGHIGSLLVLIGLFMLLPAAYALFIGDATVGAFLSAAAVSFVAGVALAAWAGHSKTSEPGLRPRLRALLRLPAPAKPLNEQPLPLRDALIVVTVGWFAVAAAGALPFLLAGTFSHWIDALFEAVSGFTTTGVTTIVALDAQPRPLLLWRSLLQWLGGMGIIVLFLSVFPRLGMSGFALFRAEVPGPAPEKALPRLSSTSKLLWLIYVLSTAIAFGSLLSVGMEPFDALNHALATVSTGGFSTRDAGVAAFDNVAVEWVLTLFMFLGGMNFLLQYRLFRFGDWRLVARDGEFKLYYGLVVGVGGLIALSLWTQASWNGAEAWRSGIFQAVSTLTTTGYTVFDYTQWPALPQALLFLLLFIGGSAGSTAGGPKLIRILIALKHGFNQLRQLLHPRSVIAVRIGGQAVSERMFAGVAAFLVLYAVVWFGGTIGLAALGVGLGDAPVASIAALGNVGTAFGATGPEHTYAEFSPAVKLFLALLMIIGRLELLSVLVVLHPAFWAARRRTH